MRLVGLVAVVVIGVMGCVELPTEPPPKHARSNEEILAARQRADDDQRVSDERKHQALVVRDADENRRVTENARATVDAKQKQLVDECAEDADMRAARKIQLQEWQQHQDALFAWIDDHCRTEDRSRMVVKRFQDSSGNITMREVPDRGVDTTCDKKGRPTEITTWPDGSLSLPRRTEVPISWDQRSVDEKCDSLSASK